MNRFDQKNKLRCNPREFEKLGLCICIFILISNHFSLLYSTIVKGIPNLIKLTKAKHESSLKKNSVNFMTKKYLLVEKI